MKRTKPAPAPAAAPEPAPAEPQFNLATVRSPGPLFRQTLTFNLPDVGDMIPPPAPFTLQIIVMSEADAVEHRGDLGALATELTEAGWSRENLMGNDIFIRFIA